MTDTWPEWHHVSHAELLARFTALDTKLDTILSNQERLLTMGTTISAQEDANTAKIVADLAVIKTGIASLQAQLASVPAPVAGSTVTQEQEDAFAAAVATADGMAATFTPPATPTA
jgi:hypothetical protein